MKGFERRKLNRRETRFKIDTIKLENHKGFAGENSDGQFEQTL
jgi:hypothetical protein